MSDIIVTIDPGLKGGLAFYDPAVELLSVIRMPLSVDRKFSPCAIVDHLRPYSGGTCVIERQHAMPKQGVASTFTTGKNYGCLVGIATALDFNVEVVSARTWKGALLPDPADRKGKWGTIRYVQQRWPDLSLVPPRGRVEHDGLADAAAILAWYLDR